MDKVGCASVFESFRVFRVRSSNAVYVRVFWSWNPALRAFPGPGAAEAREDEGHWRALRRPRTQRGRGGARGRSTTNARFESHGGEPDHQTLLVHYFAL